ncbi:E3 ubiquitin-protein ligase TRIP12-like [Actinia tenebrosa]|uniref:E3 ubiquitin-protein ligase n=1 Tax=Actinia tenebrosa TaxID=6105 RepID=A0A6P8I4T3_ACTTE|nr:E3 ubiquitin-protein ligase TRIP12-like [Actinia tenebrosa]
MAESSVEGEQGGTVFRSKSKLPAKRKSQTNLSGEYKVEEKKSKKSSPSTAGSQSITSSSSHYNLRPRVCLSSSTTSVTTTQSSSRIQSTKTLAAKKSSSSPSLGARGTEKGTEKSARQLKKTQREAPKLTSYSSSPVAAASALPFYNLTSTSSDTTVTFKSKVPKTDSSHKSASDSRLSSKLNFLRASLTSGAHRGKDLGNHSTSEGSRGSQSSAQSHRGDPPKPEGSRRSQRTTEATGSCASNSRRGSQTKKRTWTRRQQPSMSTEDGLSEQGASAGQPRLNEAGQSSSSVAERNDGSANSHSDDNELKDSDMSRLQSLLEARGVPPHLFGSLGPRMHQLLHRASSNSSNSKAQQLLQGIQSSDEGQQLQAVIEMCQLLVMGNEESLAGFPVKQAVPALINLLNKEQKFELVNHACRALTYLMESLPRSTMVVVEAIPAFLEKLQSIECMDVAEQSLTALDMLSKRHGKAILQAGGMSTCLLFLDFFSISAQRSALAIASNCCASVGPDDFHYIANAIEILSTRLQIQDKKSVESCCLAFSRLVDSFQNDKKHLKDLSAHGLLNNIQQLLIVFPPIISTGTFVMVLRMLSLLCSNCPDLAVDLIKNNIVETLQFLLFGSVDQDIEDNVELITRSPQEFFELTCSISELFPKLPQTGVFSVDALLNKSQQRSEHGLWQWRDDRGVWHSYSWIDSKIIEAAYHSGEDELSLATMGRTYTIDLNAMQQINEDTGTTRPVQRCNGSGESSSTLSSKAESVKVDSRIAILQEDSLLEDSYTYKLFSCLYSILNSSVSIAIRNRCVNAILRMIYYAPAELLQVILKRHPISSIIGGMLQSHDIRTLVNALQLAEILMQKLPDVFHISFRREGVMHKAKSLASGSVLENSSSQGKEVKRCSAAAPVVAGEPYSTHCTHPIQVFEKPPSPPSRLGEVLRGKRRSKRNPRSKEKCQSVMEPDLKKQTEVTHLTKSVNLPTTSSLSHHSKPSFFSSLTSARWNAKASTSSLLSSSDGLPRVDVNSLNTTLHALSTSRMSDNKEKIRTWIKEQAIKFCATYFDEEQGKSHPGLDVLQKLSNAKENLATNVKDNTEVLKVIRCVLSDSEEGASPFEILHSGLVPQLLRYLTSQTSDYQQPLESRLKRFLQAFMDLPESGDVTAVPLNDQKKPPLASLVAKLHSCVNQVEQFPVKVHDAPSGSSGVTGSRGSQALRFFSTHQIKCHLQRHPDCKTLKQWKGGPVKIDPLALVQAVERYLVVRGYGKLKEAIDDLDGSEDDGSDDEIDESLALELQGESMPRHHLEIMIGDKVLPYNMTVYQAIKQYGQTDEDKDTEEDQGVLGRPSIWVGQHTIWFRPLTHGSYLPSGNNRLRGGSASRSSSKTSLKRSLRDDLDKGPSSISQVLRHCLPSDLGISDPSIEVLCLMRALHVLNNNWQLLFESNENNPLISNADFINSKLSAKILRQLQDPIAVMTGNYPSWIEDLPKKCPFLFPFECRQQLFFSTAFDRERAMSKLQESIPDLINTEMSDRVAPRLDRKKHTVSRKELLIQAEKIIQDLGSSQSILEIQYEGEVGTGLGPTLEFYTLVSKEFQKSSMEMWRGSDIAPPPTEDAEEGVTYVHSPCGLFPAPIPKNTKAAALTKLRTKFRFLGRFLGRAVLDFRMIDIPLSETFYKWMLGLENSFDYRDLQYVDPTLAKSMGQLQALVRQKKRLEEDTGLTTESLQLAIENLTLDGASVEDLGLDFILPGYPNIELKKNGRNIPVTIHNLEEYIKLVVQWTFVEGVERQFQAFQEGFDSVFSLANLNGFSPHEMDLLLCGSGGENWDTKHLVDCCRPDHGYNHDSRAIKNLFEILSSYDQNQQRLFLQFVTGSPRLPVGGFRSLNPPLTIVRKTFEPPLSADNYLPSVMTCVNYLKLPDYSTKEIMEDKLKVAAQEGQRSFHLS